MGGWVVVGGPTRDDLEYMTELRRAADGWDFRRNRNIWSLRASKTPISDAGGCVTPKTSPVIFGGNSYDFATQLNLAR